MNRPGLLATLGIAAIAVLAGALGVLGYTSFNRRTGEPVALSPAARSYLGAQPVLVIAVTAEQSPLVVAGADGQLGGFLPDYISRLSVSLGSPVRLELLSFDQAAAALARGRLLAIADVPPSPAVSGDFDYSDVFLEDSTGLFVTNERLDLREAADLDGHPVAVVTGSAPEKYLASRPQVKVHPVKQVGDGLQAVVDNQADAFLGENLATLYFLQSSPLRQRIKTIGAPVSRRPYALAVRSGDAAALEVANYALRATRANGIGEQVQRRWFGAPLGTAAPAGIPPEWAFGGSITALFLVVFFGMLLRNQATLAAKVRERTRELEASEQKYRQLIEHANDAILLIDPRTGDLLEVNRFAETMFGRSRDELLRLGLRGLQQPADFNQTLAGLQQALTRGTASLDRVGFGSGGRLLLAEINLSVPQSERDRPVVQAIARDITERVHIEQQLMQQNRYLSALNRMTAALAPLQDPSSILRASTTVLADLFQVDAAGLVLAAGTHSAPTGYLSAGSSDWLHRELHSFMLLAASQEMVKRAPLPLIYKADMLEPEAASKWPALAPYTLIGIPLERSGQRVGVLNLVSRAASAFSDEDRRLLNALAQQLNTALEKGLLFAELADTVSMVGSEKRFSESILNNITNGLMTIDLRGLITSANHAADQMLGYGARELVGMPLTVFGPAVSPTSSQVGSPPPTLRQRVQETLSEGRTFQREQFTLRTRTGSQLPVGASISPLRDEQANVAGAILVFADMSEIKKLEAEREHVSHLAALGQMSAIMAHEIRNPLAGIGAGIQYLTPRFSSDPAAADHFKMILRESDRLNTLIDDILYLSRATRLELTLTRIPLLLDMILARWNETARNQNVEISREYSLDLPDIRVDPSKLERALENLVRNALEAMRSEKSGKLWVTARLETAPNGRGPRTYLAVQIANSGPPIPAESAGKILEPFYTTKGQGTGLGLPISLRTIQDHQGTLVLSSEPPRSTIFTIRLPLDL